MAAATKIDHKLFAKTLYDNRADRRYLSKSGHREILAENGLKVAKATYDTHYEAVKKEIAILHDTAHRKELKPAERERMEKIFPQIDYITGLKRIWDGEKENGKFPNFRDKLMAGKQAAEFFGWNAPTDHNININANVQALIASGKLILDAIQLPVDNKVLPPISD